MERIKINGVLTGNSDNNLYDIVLKEHGHKRVMRMGILWHIEGWNDDVSSRYRLIGYNVICLGNGYAIVYRKLRTKNKIKHKIKQMWFENRYIEPIKFIDRGIGYIRMNLGYKPYACWRQERFIKDYFNL